MAKNTETQGDHRRGAEDFGLATQRKAIAASSGPKRTTEDATRLAFGLIEGMLMGAIPVEIAHAGFTGLNTVATVTGLACRYGQLQNDGRFVLPLIGGKTEE